MQNLSEEEEIAMAELVESKLSSAGLSRYEISNYAKPGWHSRHNLNYWRSGDYLGVGAGAHSYLRDADGVCGQRWSNEKNPAKYMAKVTEASHAVLDHEAIDREKAAAEFMFLGLRITAGVPIAAFSERFGESPVERFSQIPMWIDEKLLEVEEGFLRLTARGLLLANSTTGRSPLDR
jgi:oxygen-independent coproporphyrinogen-3 oxidase